MHFNEKKNQMDWYESIKIYYIAFYFFIEFVICLTWHEYEVWILIYANSKFLVYKNVTSWTCFWLSKTPQKTTTFITVYKYIFVCMAHIAIHRFKKQTNFRLPVNMIMLIKKQQLDIHEFQNNQIIYGVSFKWKAGIMNI